MMRKFFVALLVGAVAVGLAAPAFAADLKFTGAYRVRFMFDDSVDCFAEQPVGGTPEDCSGNQFQTRFRPRFDVETEGGVRGVLRLEIGDIPFGGGTGGAIGADGINVETKWAYLDFPLPGTPLRLRAGIQDFLTSKAIVLDDDASGLSLYGKLGEIDANAWWFRGAVGSTTNGDYADDFYGLQLGMSPMKDLTLNAYVVYEHGSTTGPPTGADNLTSTWFGVGAAGKVQNIRWDLDFIHGTTELTATTDQKGWIVDGGVGMALAGTPLDLELRGWWATGDKGDGGDNEGFPVISSTHNTGAQLWTGDAAVDITEPADTPENTWGIGLIARYTVSPTLRLTGNIHYIGTVEEGTLADQTTVASSDLFGVDSVGTEFGVRIDYTIARGLVFTLTASHLLLGDDTALDGTKFDDASKIAGVVNYGF